MSDLIVSGHLPDNIKLPMGVKAIEYGSDLFEISKRIAEIDRSLFVVALDPPQMMVGGAMANWAVWQYVDGQEYQVFKAEHLDQRVLERAAEIVHVPLGERLRIFEAQEAKVAAERAENELENAYEQWGGQMRHELAKNGFTGPLTTSVRPLNRTARRAGRRA